VINIISILRKEKQSRETNWLAQSPTDSKWGILNMIPGQWIQSACFLPFYSVTSLKTKGTYFKSTEKVMGKGESR
jgi:hypothetical protein